VDFSRRGRKRARENETDCLRREIREELPKLKLGRLRLLREVKAKTLAQAAT
jgi:8-oxo-dGTP diphosphatase